MDTKTGRVIALGFFDGVHLGHGALLDTANRRGREQGRSVAVMTFDQHPDTLVAGKAVPLINSREDRIGLLSRCYGVDDVIFIHFDQRMMHMPWDTFVVEYLLGELRAAHLVCGYDFRFGDRGSGNPELLRQKCAALGVGCDVVPRFQLDGVTVSSTYIRERIAEGDMVQADRFLGHPHCLTGTVVHGARLGRSMGIPTANLAVPEGVLVPAFGVYACRVVLPDGQTRLAVTNVGVRPTVAKTRAVTVEPWILDYDGDLYGKRIRVDFYKMLRKERKFSDLDALRSEIHHNAEETRALLAKR